MNQSEVIQILEKIQLEYDISSINYKNKNVWPILRYYFSRVLMNPNKGQDKVELNDVPVQKQSLKINRSLKFKNIFSVFKLPGLYKKIARQQKDFNKLNAEVVFLSPSFEPYPDLIDNKKYSRYLDPYFETFSKNKKVIKVQLVKMGQLTEDTFVPVHKINQDIYFLKINIKEKLNRFRKKVCTEKDIIDVLYKLNLYCKSNEINFVFNSWLIDHLDEVNQYDSFFYEILHGSKTKTVFFEGYYSPCLFGLISACKTLNIKTIDFQHGVVDINYLAWNGLYKSVSYYLPEYYWVWSKKNLNEVVIHNKTFFIIPIIGGNRWLGKFKELDNSLLMKKLTGNESVNYDKKILISLQYSVFLDHMLSLVSKTIDLCSENYLWMFRIHPLSTNDEKLKVVDALEKYKNIEYEKTSSLNLYEVFKLADVHIVASSAVAIEGLQFNLPTIIIHEQGIDLFLDLIEHSIFVSALTPEKIIKNIQSFQSLEVSEEYKIETSEEQALKQFELLTA